MSNSLEKLKAATRQAAGFAEPDGIRCVSCRDPFTAANVFTPAGERETRISGLCERCWDSMFKGGSE